MYSNHQGGFNGGYGAPGFDPSAGPVPVPREVYSAPFPEGSGTAHSNGNAMMANTSGAPLLGIGIQGPGSGAGILGAEGVTTSSSGDGIETVEMSGSSSESLKRKFEEDVSQ